MKLQDEGVGHRVPAVGQIPRIGCPHGDPYCPCQDGDMCHYAGKDPMPCPFTHIVGCSVCTDPEIMIAG